VTPTVTPTPTPTATMTPMPSMTWEQVMELVKTQFVSTNCGGKEIEEKENKQGMDLFIKYASEGFTEAYFTNNVILIERADIKGEKCFYILDGERRVFILPGENEGEFIYIPFPSDISP